MRVVMKTKNLLVAAVVSLMFSGVAIAEKYGVIDMQTVILTVEEGKKARKTLEVEIKAKEKSIQNSRWTW